MQTHGWLPFFFFSTGEQCLSTVESPIQEQSPPKAQIVEALSPVASIMEKLKIGTKQEFNRP